MKLKHPGTVASEGRTWVAVHSKIRLGYPSTVKAGGQDFSQSGRRIWPARHCMGDRLFVEPMTHLPDLTSKLV
jgi:hypothetical protein